MRKVPTTRPPRRSLLPRRTVRRRLTAMYGVMFLFSGAVVLAIASGVVYSRSSVEAVRAPGQAGSQSALGQAQARIQQLQHQLAAATGQARNGVSHNLLIGSAIALGIMTVVSLLLGWVIAGRVLRPLRQMTATTQRISADSLDERLAMPGPGDELKELGDTIDGLLERLEGAFAAQRRFVANASHELRTPLTTMRASLDVAVAKPGPVPASTSALRAFWCWPARSTGNSPAVPRSRSNTSYPRRWPPGPATSAPNTSPCSTPPAATVPGWWAARRC